MACTPADIKKNLGFTFCDKPLARGVTETVFYGRLSWIDSVTYDATNKKIVTAIVMKTGKKLLRYQGKNYSNQINTGFSAGEYGNTLPQGLRYILFTNDADEEAEVDGMAQITDGFALVKRNGNPGSWKLVGFKTGLRMSNLSSDSNDETLKGAYTIEMSAPDETTTYYTLKHVTSGSEDTDAYVETLALAVS